MVERPAPSPMRTSRLMRGLRLIDVAAETNVAESRLSMLERDLATPRPEERDRLARVYGDSLPD